MTKIITIEFYTVGFFDFEKIEDRVTTNKTLSSSGGRILHPKTVFTKPGFWAPKKTRGKKTLLGKAAWNPGWSGSSDRGWNSRS